MLGKVGAQTYEATRNNIGILDEIVSNLSNIKSIGYKKRETNFITTLNGELAKYQHTVFSQGSLRKTLEPFDVAIEGPGFFEVEMPNGQRAFTRAGRLSLNAEGELVTEEGYRLLPEVEKTSETVFEVNGSTGELGLNIKVNTPKLIIPTDIEPEISDDGTINAINPETGERRKIGKIGVVVFNNPQGLEEIGKSYYLQTKSSGQAQEAEVSPNANTKLKQGFLELANVDMVAEMFSLSQIKTLITAQIKALKAIDKIYENVHYTISRNA